MSKFSLPGLPDINDFWADVRDIFDPVTPGHSNAGGYNNRDGDDDFSLSGLFGEVRESYNRIVGLVDDLNDLYDFVTNIDTKVQDLLTMISKVEALYDTLNEFLTNPSLWIDEHVGEAFTKLNALKTELDAFISAPRTWVSDKIPIIGDLMDDLDEYFLNIPSWINKKLNSTRSVVSSFFVQIFRGFLE